MGRIFEHAYAMLNEKTIQEAMKGDKPYAATGPGLSGLTYGIMAFNLSFWRNVMVRNAVLAKETAKRSGKSRAAANAALLAPALAQLALYTFLFTALRELVFNHERWEKDDDNDELLQRLVYTTATRTLPLGQFDRPVQAFTGLKYETDFANALLGPHVAAITRPAQNMFQPYVRPAAGTNSDEYKQAQGFYDLFVAPATSFALTTMPGGPITSKLYGVGTMFATSSTARDQFAEAVTGGPKGTKVPQSPDQELQKRLDRLSPEKRQEQMQRRLDKLSGN